MLLSFLAQPLPHGSTGILDEVLLYCMPLLVLLIILSIASRRARSRQLPRDRIRRDQEAEPIDLLPPDHSPRA